MIIITAKRDGFRRCGIAHSAKGISYPDDFFTAQQLAQLKQEPQLVVIEGAELAPGQEIDDAHLDPAPGASPATATTSATADKAKGIRRANKDARGATDAGDDA